MSGGSSGAGSTGARWPVESNKRIWHALTLIVAIDAAFVFTLLVFAPLVGLDLENLWEGSGAALATAAFQGAVMIGLVTWLGLVRFGRLSWADLGWTTDGLGRSGLFGALGAVAMVGIMAGVLAAIGLDLGELFKVATSYTAGQRLQWVFIGLSAAVAEESVFRGYLQPTLIAKTGMVGGVFLCSVIFALYHLPIAPNPVGLVTKLLFGLLLGSMRGRDRSLVAPMLAHFVFWQTVGAL
jgi:membrane protease YdiL (CAAX protease family)